MIPEVALRLKRAERLLQVAASNLKERFYEDSVNRSYYAVFYSVRAVLCTKEIERGKHSGIMAAFDQYFVKTGEFDKHYSEILHGLEKSRTDSDYITEPEIDEYDAHEALDEATEFVKKCREYCEGLDK